MPYVLRRHLFLIVGLLSLGLFYLVDGLERSGKIEAADALAGPMRVLIVPMYLVWLLLSMALVAIAGPVGLPPWCAPVMSGISLAAGLAPYAIVDYVVDRRRRAGIRKVVTEPSGNRLTR